MKAVLAAIASPLLVALVSAQAPPPPSTTDVATLAKGIAACESSCVSSVFSELKCKDNDWGCFCSVSNSGGSDPATSAKNGVSLWGSRKTSECASANKVGGCSGRDIGLTGSALARICAQELQVGGGASINGKALSTIGNGAVATIALGRNSTATASAETAATSSSTSSASGSGSSSGSSSGGASGTTMATMSGSGSAAGSQTAGATAASASSQAAAGSLQAAPGAGVAMAMAAILLGIAA